MAAPPDPPAEYAQTFELLLELPPRPLLPKNVKKLGLPDTPAPLRIAVTPQETLSDLRATIHDSPEGYWLGAFSFCRPGDKTRAVDEWVELSEIFAEPEERTLCVTHVPYNETEARAHIQRLRDLLTGGQADPSALTLDAGISVQDAVVHPEAWAPDEPSTATWHGWPPEETCALLPAAARKARVLPRCVRTMALSAWNPPPQPRVLQGDLLYLHLDTLEGESLHMTASVRGFFVNRSTGRRFDPRLREGAPVSASLFDLLYATSPLFLQNFAALFNDPVSTRDYFSALPVTNMLPSAPWLAREPKHDADLMRSQTAFLLTGATSSDTLDSSRDWNEELQSLRELPRSTLAERLMRDRALNRLHAELTLAATRAVPRIAAGGVTPMNPSDEPETHMYLFNNLFISKGLDGVHVYDSAGGDEAAHVAVSKDVQGVRMVSAADPQGISLLGTIVVDWLGERWVVQSIVPGLFRSVPEQHASEETAAAAVAYGGVEGPETIHTDPAFASLLAPLAQRLHLAQHTVQDAHGKEHSLAMSVDTKGLRGADGRKYLLDLSRTCPLDAAWLEHDMDSAVLEGSAAPHYPHRIVLLRPELVEQFWQHRLHVYAREKLEKQGIEATPETRVDVADFDLALNPDALVAYKVQGAQVVPNKDLGDPSVQAVLDAGAFMRDVTIPRLVADVAAGAATAADGIALSQQMHARGINMRYLGRIAHLCQPSFDTDRGRGADALLLAFRRVALQEMVVRAAKHCLRAHLRGVDIAHAGACIAHFANCLLSHATSAAPAQDSTACASLSSATLAEAIHQQVRMRFRFELPATYLAQDARKPQLLRAFAICMGIQLRLRDYLPASASPTQGTKERAQRLPFQPEDVLNVVPVVKSAASKSALVEEAFEAGRIAFTRGECELGTELMLEGIGFHEQVYGLVHPETARCYAAFASLAHSYVMERARQKDTDKEQHAKDSPVAAESITLEAAQRFQQQAVTISERTLGLDHPDTMTQYMNLAVIERALGKVDRALRYQHRVLVLWQLLYGRDHPDMVHTLSFIALLVQAQREFSTSLQVYLLAYDLSVRLFGKDSLYTGNMAHELSQAHTLAGDLKEAIRVEKEASRIFESHLGSGDALAQESHRFLSSLTSSAVRLAKVKQEQAKQGAPAQGLPSARARRTK
ncbi:Intracellular distribution of mitochondria [Malassezia vespertilionis]|uniref:Clustered mitochondria protein homolog n=1 Tax=Malassezia vespertilionis TaxID=2020962 RepID=A0A2N1J878_9BASI|nr:Intracellular distribution of mitochondria [Malassezia vespertilionis]PKI82767.1 Clu1p [Malassezia vespertilionis]WFD08216.1 Intracellular distribution of mitochondria [Malassezia vespertilionis]